MPDDLRNLEWPEWRRAVLALAILAVATAVDSLAPDGLNPTIVNPIAVVAAATAGSRRFLWGLASLGAALALLGLAVGPQGQASDFVWSLSDRAVVAAACFMVARLGSEWIEGRRRLETSGADLAARNDALETSNQELSAREEEIARQNEELQSQSEELERQSEELRITNDDLAARERTVSRLLSLSRVLAAERTHGEMMDTICESLVDLLSDTAQASALLLRRGDELHLACSFGFGPGGPKAREIRYESSFAALLLSRGQAGFLQDVTLRPEIEILQPSSGRPLRTVLGAPIMSRGRGIGTVEAYTAEPTVWTEEQVDLVTSIAAQASVSLETARLFEEITLEKQRFETIFRTLPIAILSCDDPGCRNVTANPAATTLFSAPLGANFSPFSASGSRLVASIHRQGRRVVAEDIPIVRAVLRGEEVISEELELLLSGGRRAVVLASAAPFYDSEGKITGGVGVLFDVSAQKSLERDLDARRRESEEASVRKTRFLAAVSHDIRTPANAIRLQAELLKRSATEPTLAGRIPDLAQQLERNATALVELVGEVLDLTRFDSGKIELQETDFPLNETILEECERYALVAQAKGIQLVCIPADPPVWLRTDRVKLERILDNLIDNAMKFTRAGAVTVEAAHVDGGIDLRVSDTGEGIAPEHHAVIFDEFFQIRNRERDATKGRGLGLAICKRLVDAIGAEIRVESDPGKGAAFVVRISPSRLLAAPAPPPKKASAVSVVGGGPSFRGVRIVLVEDHGDTRRATAELLRSEGAEVIETSNIAGAWHAIAGSQPQLVLLDLMLPDGDGTELLRDLRSRRPASLRGVVVLTGDSASRKRESLESLGADLVIDKPIVPQHLIRALAGLLAGAPHGA